MKIEKKIVIEGTDVSALHAEVTDVLDFFSEPSHGGEDLVKDEFPNLVHLRKLLDQLVISEPGEKVYDRLTAVQEKQAGENRIKRSFKVVRSTDP